MLSILIVNWNTREYLRACLASLQQACVGLSHEIIVVDNDSHDGSAAMVKESFPDVLLFAVKENLGFAKGNNFAYGKARGEWIWLLNPDTEVIGNAPQQMLAFLEAHPRAGAVASTLVDAGTRKPQHSCRTFPTPAALWCEGTGLSRFYSRSRRFGFYRMGWWDYADTREVEQPMASSFMMRRAAIDAIYDDSSGGLFDEAFPIYFNDVDLCLRLWQNDWPIWYLHEAQVLHHGGASTGQIKPEMIAESHRSLKRFYKKHYRRKLSPLCYYPTMWMMDCAGKARVWAARRKALE